MSFENVFVNAAEARDAASQTDMAIKNLQDAIEKLNGAMRVLHDATQTQWEAQFNQDWMAFYTKDFPAIVNALKGQAANLRTAAAAAEKLDR